MKSPSMPPARTVLVKATSIPHNPGVADTVRQSSTRLLLPLSSGIVMFLISSMERDPAVAAEAAYLSGLAVAVLVATAFAAPAVNLALGLQSLLSAATIWALPGTPDRAAALSAVLVVGGAIAILPGSTGTNRLRLDPSRLMALVLAVQLVFRSNELLDPEPQRVAVLLGWGALAAVSAHLLSETLGTRSAALATAVTAMVGAGFHATNTLGLGALAGGRLFFDSERPRSWRAAGAVLLLSPIVLADERALVGIAAGLLFMPGKWLRLLIPFALVAIGILRSGFAESLTAASLLPLVVPILLPQLAFDLRRHTAFLAGAILLALATPGIVLQQPASLAIPLAATALRLSNEGRRASIQNFWAAGLFFGSLLCAAPPWIRDMPLLEALHLTSLEIDGRGALTVLATFASVWLLTKNPLAKSQSLVSPSVLTGAVIAVGLFIAAPIDTVLLIHRQPIVLNDAQPTWTRSLETPVAVQTIVVDTTFANSTSAVHGAVLARLRIETQSGEQLQVIRIGQESGEWAAQRAEIAALPGFRAPAPHLSWVDPSGEHFGQRYRTVWKIDPSSEITDIELSLEPGAPAGLVLTIFHLELRG